MNNLINLLTGLHEGFFEHDMDNKVVMGIGFAISAVSIVTVFGLYML